MLYRWPSGYDGLDLRGFDFTMLDVSFAIVSPAPYCISVVYSVQCLFVLRHFLAILAFATLLFHIMAPKKKAGSPSDAGPAKRKAITMEMKLAIIKRSEKGETPTNIGKALLGFSRSTVASIIIIFYFNLFYWINIKYNKRNWTFI